MANNEINERAKINLEVSVTHEVGTGDRLNDSVLSGLIGPAALSFLILLKLCSSCFVDLLIGKPIRILINLLFV